MNPLFARYLRTVVINLLVAAVIAWVAQAVLSVNGVIVLLLWGVITIGINTIGVVGTYYTLQSLTKRFNDVPYQDLFEAYVVYKIQKQLPMEEWTRQKIYACLALYRTTGGAPIF